MENVDIKQLRLAIAQYAKPDNSKALIIFSIDMLVYTACIGGIIFMENSFLRIIFSIIVGLKMASLFVIAHDAAHDSYTDNKLLNKVIARLSFLPCYHNYSLWLIAHNRLHHQLTNIKGVNSWSPLSKKEFDEMPAWRKKLERLYRSPAGIPLNYLIERWWKDKFFPYKRLINEFKLSAWLDFFLVLGYLTIQIIAFAYIGKNMSHTNAYEMIILGVIIPLIVFCFLVGFSVYQQHTHESVPWFKTVKERDAFGGVEDVTVHVRYPYWYNLVSHNVMEHTAHHVDPRVPLYHLADAQLAISNVLQDDMKSISFSLKSFQETMRRCKLYDYKEHSWVDFDGKPTSAKLIEEEASALPCAA